MAKRKAKRGSKKKVGRKHAALMLGKKHSAKRKSKRGGKRKSKRK